MQQWIRELPWLGTHRSGKRTPTLTSQLVFITLWGYFISVRSTPRSQWVYLATGAAGRLQPVPAGLGAGGCSSTEQSQQVPMEKASSPVGDICFISQIFELGSPNTLETSLCDACQFFGWKSWQETYFKEGGNIPVMAELLRLSWFISMSFS